MNKGLFIIIMFCVLACNSDADKNLQEDTQKIDSLEKENAQLRAVTKQSTTSIEKPHEVIPKYVYAVITYTKQELLPDKTYSPPNGSPVVIPSHYTTVKKLWFSTIKTFQIFDDDSKYRLLDEAERECNFSQNPGRDDLEISKREVFAFNSYADASEDRNIRRGKQEK